MNLEDLTVLAGKRITEAKWMVAAREFLDPPLPNLRVLQLTFEDGGSVYVLAPDSDVSVSYQEPIKWLAESQKR